MKIYVSWITNVWARRAAIVISYPIVVFAYVTFNILLFWVTAPFSLCAVFWGLCRRISTGVEIFTESAVNMWGRKLNGDTR